MAFTLSNLLVGAFQGLGQMTIGNKATGGSTTTVIDSTQANTARDNAWKNGAMFITRDAGGAGALPEGQYQRISAFTNSSGTFTVETAFSTAVAAGDIYGYTSPYYPLRQMQELANDALRALGDVDLVDTTTLDTVTGDTEYAAAVTWKRSRPLRVDIQTATGDAQDNQWVEWPSFEWVPAQAGSTGLIIFPDYPTASRDVRVWYRGAHPALLDYDDVVHDSFDPELVVLQLVVKALEWQNGRSGGTDEYLLQRLGDARQELANRLVTTRPYRAKRKPKLLIVGRNQASDDQFTYPA